MKTENKYKFFKRGQVLYVDFGNRRKGLQGGIRPCIVVSNNASNHVRAPQITVCPLTTKLKDIIVHVKVMPLDVNGYHLREISHMLPEDIQTVLKEDVISSIGYIDKDSELMKRINKALAVQLGIIDKNSKECECCAEKDR